MCTIDIIISELKIQGRKQKELMDFLGIHPNVFTDWKAGRARSYTKYIYQIAAFLNVAPEYLLGKTNERQKEIAPDLTRTEREREIVEHYRGLPEDEQEVIYKMITSLKKLSDKPQ